MLRPVVHLTAALAVLLLASAPVAAAADYPLRIDQRLFIYDEAGMVDSEDAATIRGLCDALLTERRIPIIVVTIPSLARYNAGSWSIERYAHNLFDEWGIGFPDHNYGVLLLISQSDRKARIELGADWSREHDAVCRKIMDDLIIPEFKQGRFSAGIRLGVQGLDKMARGESIPSRPLGQRAGDAIGNLLSRIGNWIMLPFVVIISILSRILGGGRWGGRSGGGIFSGGGSFSGGSFGGGFSGGGGASGSW